MLRNALTAADYAAEYGLTDDVVEQLLAYARDGRMTGGFLAAVLENDLYRAVERADLRNRGQLAQIVVFIHNELPTGCYGSRDVVSLWLAGATRR